MRAYNSTIRINKKQLKCGHFDFAFSGGMCKQCALIQSIGKQDEKDSLENESLSGLIDDADSLVARYIKLKAMDSNGHIECYTCGKYNMMSEMDAGHYIPRGVMYLRFDVDRNIRPQCHHCNRAKYGMSAKFGQKLELEKEGVTERLLEESRIIYKYTREELRNLISEYTEKIRILKLNTSA